MNDSTLTRDKAIGALSKEWAGRIGLDTSVIIGVGAIDAHFGAVGGEIKPYCLNKVIGTSTCDMLIVPNDKMKNILVHGICGQVDGSIIPGMQGMEAGQSAFGDIYAWFKKVLLWPLQNIAIMSGEKDVHKELQKKISENILIALSEQAGKIPVGESGIIALDWLNGRRTPDANQSLRGAITGLNLASDAPGIYRALVEAAAFGAKAIVERFISEGIEIRGITALGGVAQKSPFVMQVLADVLGMPIEVVRSEQTCALGACMFASVVAGIYPDITVAQKKLGKGMLTKYAPDKQNQKKYIEMYNKYLKLGAFYN
jgi:L-ribulokinase